MKNKIYMLNLKPTKIILVNIIMYLYIIISLIISYNIKTYTSLKLTGILNCDNTCIIDTTLSYEYISKINKNSKISSNNKSYKIENIEYSEPYLNNNIAYQDIKLVTNIKEDNKIIEFKILYNKQRILTKIINIIKGE